MVPSAYDTTGDSPHSSPINQKLEHDALSRRFWLLRQALKSGSSMAEALKIAADVEAFLVLGTASCSSNDTLNKNATAPLETMHGTPRAISQAALSSLLEPDKKAAISARLKAGDSDAQLAVRCKVFACRLGAGPKAKPPPRRLLL